MRSVLLLVCLVAATAAAHAQVPHATLLRWQADTDRALRDRAHNAGGIYYDRGLWRRYTPDMDPEYAIDLFGLKLSPTEAYDQIADSEFGTGYVGWMGSIEQARFATAHGLRLWEQAADRFGVAFDAEVDQTSRRDGGLSTLGGDLLLGPADSLGRARPDGPRVGFRQTFSRAKTDLDLTLRAATGRLAAGRAALTVHALDFANNEIYVRRGVWRPLNDTVRAYDRQPFGVAGSLVTPPLGVGAWTARAEAVGGLSTRSRATLDVRSSGRAFEWADEARYVGGLAEVGRMVGDVGVTLGLVGRWRASATARAEGGAGFESRQAERSGGAFVLARRGDWLAEAWAEQGGYADEQDGTDFAASSVPRAFRFAESFRQLRLRLGRTPGRGLRLDLRYLAYDAFDREGVADLAEYLALRRSFREDIGGFQHRLSGGIGWTFRPGTWFTVGSNADLDRDRSGTAQRLYDGGYGRIVFAL